MTTSWIEKYQTSQTLEPQPTLRAVENFQKILFEKKKYAQDLGKSRPNLKFLCDGLDPGSIIDASDSYSNS